MKLLFALFMLGLQTFAFSQPDNTVPVTDSIYKTNFLDGIFETKEDFIKGRRKNFEIYPKNHKHDDRYKTGPVANPGHMSIFRYKSNNKIVTKVFAISYQGFLYFQTSAIMEDIDSKDRFQNNYNDYQFVRALIGGQNYIYTEADFADGIEQGLVMQSGPGGYSAAEGLMRSKGVVWDYWKHEFNIFRHCKDFNAFITEKYPEGVQQCDGRKTNLLEVRKAIERIK